MSHTYRRDTIDGMCWRGCDGSKCAWCSENRQNKKIKETTRAKEIINNV